MKRVGIFFSLTSYGGVQTCVISLIRGLNSIGIVPELLTDEPVNQKIISEFQLKLNSNIVDYSISKRNKRRLGKFLKGGIDLVYYFKTSWLKKKYDFYYLFTYQVIVNDHTPHLYYLSMSPKAPGYSGSLIFSKTKLFVYNVFFRFFAPVYEIHGNINNYVINSEYTAQWFYKNYKQRIKVVYPSNLISPIVNINYSEKNLVLFISRINIVKRPELFIDLAEDNPDLKFVIIGVMESNDYIEYLRHIIKDKGLSNLDLLVNVKFNELTAYLHKAKFYVFTSKNEHFGITTVEAMMYGAVPFVHNSGGQKEIVPWTELRFDDNELKTKFRKLVSLDEKALNGFRKKAEAHVKTFSESNYINSMLEYVK